MSTQNHSIAVAFIIADFPLIAFLNLTISGPVLQYKRGIYIVFLTENSIVITG